MAFIDLKNVSLEYPVYGTSSRSLKTTIVNAATGGVLGRASKVLTVQALRALSINLRDGDRLGLVGHNGSGKSSLLRLLAGIYTPTSGSISIRGKANTLFDITVGMDPYLSGIENIKIQGLILGHSKDYIRQATDEIVEFAELGEFIKMPLRTFSAGMLLRLGFSIATHFATEILLIDEVMSVGDASFLEKAKQRIKQLIDQTKIVVMANHSEQIIREFCNRILCLEHGTVKFLGTTNEFFREKVKV